jgi:hypothetical protein
LENHLNKVAIPIGPDSIRTVFSSILKNDIKAHNVKIYRVFFSPITISEESVKGIITQGTFDKDKTSFSFQLGFDRKDAKVAILHSDILKK